MLVFKGIQKTTLIDYPGEVACTVFLPKCNFRCGFCYNAALVLDKDTGIKITEAEFFKFLQEREGFLDAVCITGGEPTMHAGLPEFCAKLKRLGFKVKVDTNGTNPSMLQRLIESKTVDYIAMDIKARKEKYAAVANARVDMKKIQGSIDLLMQGKVDYEFRLTVVPKLHKKSDIISIGKWLHGAKRFYLQQFKNDVPLLDKSLENSRLYAKETLQEFADALKKHFGHAGLRGI